ncbi:MAG: DUF456 family protein, partial [Longimicrobiales bacterium]
REHGSRAALFLRIRPMELARDVALIGLMVIGLVLIPFGLPGLWLIVATVAGATLAGLLGSSLLLLALVVAAAAELLELLLLKRYSARYGGSPRAFWGAIAGGLIGIIVGVPLPIIGSVIGGIVGTFAGAALATYTESRAVRAAARVGWGTVLARIAATAVKVIAGVAIMAVSAWRLLV